MAGKLGINGADKPPVQQEKKKPAKFEFVEFSAEVVKKDIEEQIFKIRQGRNNYLTLSKLAAGYLMTPKKFREVCFNDPILSNLLEIYNSIYVEHIMTEAIASGKINTQTEDFLKNELQAYTGSGFEQNITWVLDLGKLVDNDGVEFELEADIDRSVEEEILPWEDVKDKE